MQTKLSKVVIAVAVVIALVGAVGVVSAEMDTNATDAPMHSGGDHVGHMTGGVAAMGEMAHMGEHMNGQIMEQMNNRDHSEHHDRNHHDRDHGHC